MRNLAFVTLMLCLSGCALSAVQPSHRIGSSPTATRICHGCDTPRFNNLAGAGSSATIIKAYYRSINARAFRRAYSYIVPTGRPTFALWKSGYGGARYVDLRDLAGAMYRIRQAQGTFTCAGTRIIATNLSGPPVSYGGFYMLERSQGRWEIDLPGSRLRRNGQALAPSRATCMSAIPRISSGTPKEILDVSFVDSSHGWLLGLPCAIEEFCHRLSVAVTSDSGSSWRSIASSLPGPNRANSIRFVDGRNGWVYGPALYATHDGGRTWKGVPLHGQISDVIPVGHTVWAVDKRCRGNNCSTTLIASDASGNGWRPLAHQPIRHATPIQLDRIDTAHSWLLYRTDAFTNPVPRLIATSDGGVTWFSLPFPCGREFDTGVRIAASNDHNLYLVCASQPGMGQQFKEAFHSTNGGRRWSLVAATGSGLNNLTASGYLSDLAVTGPEAVLLALGRGTLVATTDGGRIWHPVIPEGRANPGGGGVGPVVFINPRDGWLVSFPYYLFHTTDGGRTWQELLEQGKRG